MRGRGREAGREREGREGRMKRGSAGERERGRGVDRREGERHEGMSHTHTIYLDVTLCIYEDVAWLWSEGRERVKFKA